MNNSDEVIDSIKKGDAKMHSHGYFVARAILAIIAAIAVFLLVFFIATFIIFALQLNGGFYATGFGPSGWLVFLGSLPWSLLLLSIALVLILWILLRRYAVIYHQPFLYPLLLLIVVISLACFFLSTSSIHGGIFRYVSRYPIPGVTGMYEFETSPMNGIYRGQVLVLATSSFILTNELGQTSTVLILPDASSEIEEIAPGDYVIIFGQNIATATIQAAGVERIEDYR